MKLADIKVGDTLAYSTKRDIDSKWQITKVEVVDLAPSKYYREKGTVLVRFFRTKRNWETNEIENYTADERVALRYLVGDYTELVHDLEIREKNREIGRLKEELESKRRTELLARVAPTFETALKVPSYHLKNGRFGRFELELNEDQLRSLERILNDHNRAERARQIEQERAEAERAEAEQVLENA